MERLIGSLRREYWDHLCYWNTQDLERKLERFRNYFNSSRVHQSLHGNTPDERAEGSTPPQANFAHYRWQAYCHGLVQLPMAA